MASRAKRAKVESAEWPRNLDQGIEEALSQFLNWCKQSGLHLNPKVYVSKEGTVADYGLVAKGNIEEGELLFSIPRSAILSQHTTSIRDLLKKEEAALESRSGWVPLLLCLMFEITSVESRWRPYFSLWPGFSTLNHPMFWSEEERNRLLLGTGVALTVEKDLINIEDEYNSIVLPFMKSHPGTFDPHQHTLELYKKLVAFVMAYSFQEPFEDEDEDKDDDDEDKTLNPPIIVPMADILNHVANHNANLEFTPEYLKMVSIKKISEGEEIFNTYGQLANWQLLHMYGFTEPYPSNSHEAMDIQMQMVYDAALQAAQTEDERRLLFEKWEFLTELEIVGEGGDFVIGRSGVLTEEELYSTLKVLSMSMEEFEEYKANDGWEEEGDISCLANSVIPKLKPAWKKLLHNTMRMRLKSFSSGLKEEEATLGNEENYQQLSKRERDSLQVRYAQKMILHQLLQLTA